MGGIFEQFMPSSGYAVFPMLLFLPKKKNKNNKKISSILWLGTD